MAPTPIYPISPASYEQEYRYWPWGRLITAAARLVAQKAPRSGLVLDYMCGTGFLLQRVRELRPDLRLIGCDINPDFVDHGRSHYPGIEFACCDALEYAPPSAPDLVVCTGGVHHLDFRQQPTFIAKVGRELAGRGGLLVGEETIRGHEDEVGRRLAVVELNQALLSEAIRQHAPDALLRASVELVERDLFLLGEWKLSDRALRALLGEHFGFTKVLKPWPARPAKFGDRLIWCTPRRKQPPRRR